MTTDPDYIVNVGATNVAGNDGLVVLTFDLIGPVADPITEVNKKVDKTTARVGDIITYTINITNGGVIDAENVKVIEQIKTGTSYVAGSVTASVAFTGDPTTEILLTNPIIPSEIVTITYQITADTLPPENPILNVAVVEYTFTPPGGTPLPGAIDSNEVSTLIYENSRGVKFI